VSGETQDDAVAELARRIAAAKECAEQRGMLGEVRLPVAVAETILGQFAARDAEVERLRKLADDWIPDLHSMCLDGGAFDMTLTGAHALVTAQVEACRTILDDADADNYVEIDFHVADGPTYKMVIGRPNKPTPHEMRRRAEAKLAAVEDVLDGFGHLTDPGPSGHDADCLICWVVSEIRRVLTDAAKPVAT
jgi:hypothetical protein